MLHELHILESEMRLGKVNFQQIHALMESYMVCVCNSYGEVRLDRLSLINPLFTGVPDTASYIRG
jgi:hypothetical protein